MKPIKIGNLEVFVDEEIKLWDCSIYLSEYLFDLNITKSKVLELGCGTALPSILLSKLGNEIIVTDLKEYQKIIEKEMEYNLVKNYKFIPHIWGVFDSEFLYGIESLDLVIASDVFYDKIYIDDLFSTITYLLNEFNCKMIFSHYERIEKNYENYLNKWNLDLKLLSSKNPFFIFELSIRSNIKIEEK